MIKLLTTLAAAGVLAVGSTVVSAGGATAHYRTVTVATNTGNIVVSVKPGDSFALLQKGGLLRVRRADGSVVSIGITGFRSMSVTKQS